MMRLKSQEWVTSSLKIISSDQLFSIDINIASELQVDRDCLKRDTRTTS